MKLVLNEKEVLDRALKDGIIEDKPTTTIKVLAKHYFGIGQSKKQVISSIDNFMEQNYHRYVFSKWQETIKSIVNGTYRKKSYEMLHINKINIYIKELETIRAIKNLRLEKLAFVLLVYAKLFNEIYGRERNWVNADLKDIFSDTKMAVGKNEGALMVKVLCDMDLVRPSKMVDSADVKVLFVKTQGNVAIEIRDFRDIIFYYLQYIGEKIGNCEVCKRFIRLTSNRQKYCKDCWKEHRNKYQKIWDKTRRIRKSDN